MNLNSVSSKDVKKDIIFGSSSSLFKALNSFLIHMSFVCVSFTRT